MTESEQYWSPGRAAEDRSRDPSSGGCSVSSPSVSDPSYRAWETSVKVSSPPSSTATDRPEPSSSSANVIPAAPAPTTTTTTTTTS